MFFLFFPFAEKPAAKPAFQYTVRAKSLPMLPRPRGENGAGATPFADTISYAGHSGADLIRQFIGAYTSSLTALGNHTHVLFSQAASALAFDRMLRQALSLYGMGFAAFGTPSPQPGFAGFWQAPVRQPTAPSSPFSFFAWPLNPWVAPSPKPSAPAANPLSAFTDAFSLWTSFLTPAQSQSRTATSNASPGKPPYTAAVSLPGCTFSMTFG